MPAQRTVDVERSSRIPRPAAEVWARVTSPAGIADELRPWLRMTTPPGLRGRTVADVPLGQPLGRAWLLLGGVLPVEYDDLRIAELVEGPAGRHFHERSSMLLLSVWEHRREVVADGPDGALVTDRLRAVPRRGLDRVPGVRRVVAGVVGALFAHRHRRLARWAQTH